MTQPKFAPITDRAGVRGAFKLPGASVWYSHRPADYRSRPGLVHGPNMGNHGPDQGYALLLAGRLRARLHLAEPEHADDVLAGVVAIALRRASIVGRAPMMGDLELAAMLFGYLDDAPEPLVEERARLFDGISHDYCQQRDLADLIPESTLRLSTQAVRERLAAGPDAWRQLTGTSS